MKPLQKTTLSLSITLALTLGSSAWAGIYYSGSTSFVSPFSPNPAQGAVSWDDGYHSGKVDPNKAQGVHVPTVGGQPSSLDITDGASLRVRSFSVGSINSVPLEATKVKISGTGTTVFAESAYIAATKIGAVNISNGALFHATQSFTIAPSGNVLLTSGARLQVDSAPGVDRGLHILDGNLDILDGAVAEIKNGTAIDRGSIRVSGTGSQLETGTDLTITGNANQGASLTVDDGGQVDIGRMLTLSSSSGSYATLNIRTANGAPGATVSAGSMLVDNIDSRLNVTGAGSLLTMAGDLISSGWMALTAGGKIVADTLTNRSGGILLADGRGTTLTVTNGLINDNNLLLSNGAIVRAGSLTNSGTVHLHNEDTRLEVAGQLTSTNTLAVEDGATLAADSILLRGGSTGQNSTLTLGGSGGTVLSDAVTLASNASSRAVVNFAHSSSDLRFAPRITGDGDVNVSSGITTLLAQNDYRGDTRLSGGLLRAGAENAFSAASAYTLTPGGMLDLNGFSQRTGDIINGGTLNLAGKTAGAVLTVAGNYTGNNGTLIMGTALAGDASATDRFVVTGDVSGTTNVRVNNLGGRGAATLNGIELIEVQGSADSNAFRQDGRIVAGAYDYRLIRGDQNWYLTNRIDEETGLPIIGDGGGENPGEGGGENPGNGGGENPGEGGGEKPGGGNPGDGSNPGNGEGVIVLRPEGGAYAANLAAASTLFDTRMSDRQGTRYLDPLTGKEQYTSLWLRVSRDHNRLSAGSGQLSTRGNSVVTMLGGDVMATDKARLGVMAGYGNSKSNTWSDITGYRAKGQINGYTTGLYGTWFAEGTDEKGLWADSTLQYSWFNNSVDGEDEASESYKSKGLSASLSTGYVIPLGEDERKAFFLQPQARAGWSGIKADDHTERNGTLVQGSGQDNVSSSVGVKAFMKSHAAANSQSGRTFTSFAEANWIHNTKTWGVRMDDVAVTQSGSRNIGEVRVGVDSALGGGFSVKGTIGQQVGDKGWSDTAATLGVSYSF